MSASHRKSTQVYASPGQTESQVDPSSQLASTCESAGLTRALQGTGLGGPTGYGFSAVLVINSVSILAILVINRVWFFHSSLLLEKAFFFSLLSI